MLTDLFLVSKRGAKEGNCEVASLTTTARGGESIGEYGGGNASEVKRVAQSFEELHTSKQGAGCKSFTGH